MVGTYIIYVLKNKYNAETAECPPNYGLFENKSKNHNLLLILNKSIIQLFFIYSLYYLYYLHLNNILYDTVLRSDWFIGNAEPNLLELWILNFEGGLIL